MAEDPVRFFRPPYVGAKGWVGVRIDRKPDWRVVAGLVADAHRLVAPPHLVEGVGEATSPPTRGWQAGWLSAAQGAPPSRRRGRRTAR